MQIIFILNNRSWYNTYRFCKLTSSKRLPRAVVPQIVTW